MKGGKFKGDSRNSNDEDNVMGPGEPISVNSGAAEISRENHAEEENSRKEEGNAWENFSEEDVSEDNENAEDRSEQLAPRNSPNFTRVSETEEDDEEEEEEEESPPKKQKRLSSMITFPSSKIPENGDVTKMASLTSTVATAENSSQTPQPPGGSKSGSKSSKKSNKKNTNVWTRPTSRKGKKKNKTNGNGNKEAESADKVLITPVLRFPDKNDDSPDMEICLSKVYKAEKVEVSEDRLTAGSVKGYRMVRATRGVVEGAWYFEIKVVQLGETGHTRLGWSTDKGDLQAPVGYDGNSFGYRDIDGSKVHKALREKYGEEGYKQGDVIGFYINLPEGNLYAPNPPSLVWFKGQRYVSAPGGKEDPAKVVPGSEIAFFKNGVCQGTAFKDLFGGRYYPAASMYTLPNQPNCTVKFNFGPDFEFFPEDFDERPVPRPMVEVPYHGLDVRVENGSAWHSTRMCPMLNVVRGEQGIKIVDAAAAAAAAEMVS